MIPNIPPDLPSRLTFGHKRTSRRHDLTLIDGYHSDTGPGYLSRGYRDGVGIWDMGLRSGFYLDWERNGLEFWLRDHAKRSGHDYNRWIA